MSGHRDRRGLDELYEAAGQHRGEQRALIALGVVGLSLALILGAFVLGRGVAEEPTEASPASASKRVDARSVAAAALGKRHLTAKGGDEDPEASRAPAASPTPPPLPGRLSGKVWRGRVKRLAVRNAGASCRARASIDAGGNRVGYPADHVLDNSASTAWRCRGKGHGVTLTLNLKGERTIAQVGIVPGYAKTDPVNQKDRYAQNRRIARVRWMFGRGRWAEQTLNTSRDNRRLQTMRIPPVRTDRVRLRIENSVRAQRNTVAISTVRLARPRR